jgi:hypothetical protein
MEALMAREPQRREQPAQLSAAIVPFERALLARAKALEQTANSPAVIATDPADAVIMARLSTEFRALAEELKYW